MHDDMLPMLIDHTTDDDDARRVYESCPEDPPITPISLAELETGRIFNNPKLRHDVNFDRELHFRPNLDGLRGKQKATAAKRYWKAVGYELRKIQRLHEARQFTTSTTEDDRLKSEIRTVSRRLPKVFTAVRDILKSLVPESEQSKIIDRLDVDLLMQQIINGVLNMVDLASWLAKVIKTHCAPMRDAKVNEMEQTVIDAERAQDVDRLADGLRQLIDIMEAMKLDVANHQIRHIRPLLIKNAVDFQQRYNHHRIKIGKMDIEKSLRWLQSEIDITHNDILGSTPLDAVCSALLWDMISPNGREPFTSTFYLDFDRLKSLSAEMHNYIHREIAHNILTELLPKQSGSYVLEAWTQLHKYLAAAVEPHDLFENNIELIASQIARIAVNASPGASPPPEQWTAFSTAYNRLSLELASESQVFARHKAVLFHRVLPKLQLSVHKHIKLSALELQDVLVPQVVKSGSARPNGFGAVLLPPVPSIPVDQDHNLIRRLTHIIVLHWQVWGDLLYLNEADHDLSARSSGSSSPPPDTSYAPQGIGGLSSATHGKDVVHISATSSEDGMNDGSEDLTTPAKNDNALPEC